MRANRLVLLALITGLMVTACSGDKDKESAELVKYKNCLETATSKLLDETGSNFEYAQEQAVQLCAQLKPATTP
jgi:hypothetical protein